MHKYRLISKKGEGTFSEVLKAHSIKNGKYLAIKCMKSHFESIEQVNSLREIQALRRLSPYPHIIKLYEVLYDQPTGRLALVFELMDRNIYELIRGRRHRLPESTVKMYTYQLIKAMDHMHRNGIFHRDIKPENILIMDKLLKLADFGSCRGIFSKQPYTEYISTRWYRAPECLLTDGHYGYKMDMWGVGCVLFEILALYPLFPGENEADQIDKIHTIMGTPPSEVLAKFKRCSNHMSYNFPPKQGKGIAKLLPDASPEVIDLILKLLAYDPEDRITARQALRHPWFQELRAADKRQAHANPTARASASSSTSTRASARSSASHATARAAVAATGGSTSQAGAVDGAEGSTGTHAHGGEGAGADAGAGGGASGAGGGGDGGKGGSTISSDPGLPTIGAKGGPKSKRSNPASSTIALPVSSSTIASSKGHHGHTHGASNAGGASSGFNTHSHPRAPAIPDASLPPIGKPAYSSSLRVGGVSKYRGHHKHHGYGKHGRKGKDYNKSKASKYSYPTGRTGKFSQTSTTARSVAGSVASKSSVTGAHANPNKYLSPYSQKSIQKQRGN